MKVEIYSDIACPWCYIGERRFAAAQGLGETRAEIAEARELGVRAVPTFVFDEQYRVEGGQPPEVFRSVLNEVEERTVAARAAEQGT